MYSKILVAVDHSPGAKPVFESALKLAELTGSELVLLHALSKDADDNPLSFAPFSLSYTPEVMEQYQKEWETFVQQCSQQLQSMLQQAEIQGVKAEVVQTQGNPGRVICQYATDNNVDLIVMGRRGNSTLGEMFIGSVSSYVLHRSHCNVHIVQSS
ncbi:MAG: universal stress protein [Microcoleaceae cyanobacterium]